MSTVVIADDHPIVVKGLRVLLPSAGFKVLGDANTARSCVALVERLRPDLLLLDLRMPGRPGPGRLP